MKDDYVVYLISQYVKGSPTKIGYTGNLLQRLYDIQVHNPYKIKVQCALPCDSKEQAQKLEKYLHRSYCKEHLRGEWFDLTKGNKLPKILSNFNRKNRTSPKIEDALSGKIYGYTGNLTKDLKVNKGLMEEIKFLKSKVLELEQTIEDYLDTESYEEFTSKL